MGARSKLNGAYFNGALAAAGVIGAIAGSWTVFGLALTALVISFIISGDIRPGSGPRR